MNKVNELTSFFFKTLIERPNKWTEHAFHVTHGRWLCKEGKTKQTSRNSSRMRLNWAMW